MSRDQQQKIQVPNSRMVKLIGSLQTDWIWVSDWVFKKEPTWDYSYLKRMKARQTSLKITSAAEQDEETTKRKEEVDGRNI